MSDAMFLAPGVPVSVTAGPLEGHRGAVIRDESLPETGRVSCDRVWVLLDAGANPQHFTHDELAEQA